MEASLLSGLLLQVAFQPETAFCFCFGKLERDSTTSSREEENTGY